MRNETDPAQPAVLNYSSLFSFFRFLFKTPPNQKGPQFLLEEVSSFHCYWCLILWNISSTNLDRGWENNTNWNAVFVGFIKYYLINIILIDHIELRTFPRTLSKMKIKLNFSKKMLLRTHSRSNFVWKIIQIFFNSMINRVLLSYLSNW